MGTPRTHPLRRLFNELVKRHFFHDAKTLDTRVAGRRWRLTATLSAEGAS